MSTTQMPMLRPGRQTAPFSKILKDQETFGSGRGIDTEDRINSWFDTLMIQAGVQSSPTVILMLCLLSGMTLGGLVYVFQENLLVTAMVTMMGFLLPILVAMGVRARRQSVMMRQIPLMLEELARAAKAGRSLEQSLELVARDTPNPLGAELQLAQRRVRMGMPLGEAMSDLPDRTGLMTLSLLRLTLQVQQQTGGDLVTVLERLSRTVRDRMAFLGRLRAATAASRATAILMIAVPPLVLLFFSWRDPDYFQKLIGSVWGRNITIAAVVLEIVGAIWVLRILSDTRRS